MKRRILSSVIISLVLLAAVGLLTLTPENKVSGQAQSRGWRVWVKTSPCSGRFDWLSVARDNPPDGGGLNTYVPYETVIAPPPPPALRCTDSTEHGCTFAEAEALRETLRGNSKFFSYCCRDYSVWTNDQTRETSVFLVRAGTPGLGWRFVKGELCCEEAEALAGKPGVCSGKKQGQNVFGAINQNAGLNGKTLKFYGATTPEQCQADCEQNAQCKGFTFMRAGAHSPSDPKMCYLMSEATSFAPSSCCISGIKNDAGERRRSGRTSSTDSSNPPGTTSGARILSDRDTCTFIPSDVLVERDLWPPSRGCVAKTMESDAARRLIGSLSIKIYRHLYAEDARRYLESGSSFERTSAFGDEGYVRKGPGMFFLTFHVGPIFVEVSGTGSKAGRAEQVAREMALGINRWVKE